MEAPVCKCSRCNCTQLIKYFGENRKGKPYKTCNRCRHKQSGKGNNDKLTREQTFKVLLKLLKEKSNYDDPNDKIEIFDPDTMEYL